MFKNEGEELFEIVDRGINMTENMYGKKVKLERHREKGPTLT